MKLLYAFLSLLLVGFILNSCSKLTSAEKFGDDIYAVVSIKMGGLNLNTNRIQVYVGQIINFGAEKDVVPSATELKEKWNVEPATVADVDEYGLVEIKNLGKADLIVGLYDKKQNLVASDTLILYAQAKKTLQLDGPVQTFTKKSDEAGIFLGSSGTANLYNSTNYGDAWNPVNIPVSNSAIRNIGRSPADPNYLLATYRELDQCCDTEKYTGVLISKDNGQSWQEKTHPYEYKSADHFYDFSDIAFAPDDREVIYILSRIYSDEGGIRLYKSSDSGTNWEVLKTFNRGSSTHPELFVDNQHTIIVGSSGSVNSENGYVSTDYGNSWIEWPRGITSSLLHMDESGGLYARTFEGTSTSSSEQIVYSDDKGKSWDVIFEHELHNLIDVDTYNFNNVAVLMKTGYSKDFAIKISKNSGNTWMEFETELPEMPSIRPHKIKILGITEESMELLLFFGNPSLSDDEGQVWKLRVYYEIL